MMRYFLNMFLLPFTAMLLASMAAAETTTVQPKTIAGWIEKVRFPENDLIVKAKLDTGAKTSSIYAINLERFEKDGEDWVRFDLFLEDIQDEAHRLTLEKPVVRKVLIKNHDGKHDERVVILLDFCFSGGLYSTEFTLADRNEFIYNVLLGRRFLSGVAIVDAQTKYLTVPECTNPLAVETAADESATIP